MEPLRILLVDDHALFREGLAALLAARPEFQVIGQAEDGVEAVRLAVRLRPDLILMDISMPGGSGLEAVRAVVRQIPGVRVAMLTVSDDEDDLFEALKSGAVGYILKSVPPRRLFEMLAELRNGEAALSGKIAARVLAEFRQAQGAAAATNSKGRDEEALSPRELEVLAHVVQGDTNEEIAAALYVTENTVKMHLRNIMEKLHSRNRVQIAVKAVKEGLVPPSASG